MNSSSGAFLENAIYVKNETELKSAINNAPTGKSTTIALDNDITLTNTTDDHNSNYYPVSIIIPADKDITLTSNKANGYHKLNGAVNGTILYVAPNAILRLDGISVIHTSNTGGGGVSVYTFAEFYLYNGIISGNKVYGGHGVTNYGLFVMSGGEISGNTGENGGGVYNSGTFVMSGGTIYGNTAENGGGVYNMNLGIFTMSGGKIVGNTAELGGGVYNGYNFTMSEGTIYGNTAENGGGVYNPSYYSFAVFNRQGGKISGNAAKVRGNNVYPDDYDNNELPTGNGGSSSGDGGGLSNGDGLSDGGNSFILRDIVFVCVGVALVIVAVAVLLFTSKKELKSTKEKL